MPAFINLTGQRFGRLVVVEQVGKDNRGRYQWLCLCDCGNKIVTDGYYLRCGDTQSCGCLNKDKLTKRSTKHGHKTRKKTSAIYETWRGMIQRCTNSKNKSYHNYGGRGIVVCERWTRFSDFIKDMPGWKPGLTIERIKNEKGYFKENCRWATPKEQQRNTRRSRFITHNGKTQ